MIDVDAMELEKGELLALALVSTFPTVSLCEMGNQFPVEHQNQVFEMGLQMARQWHELGMNSNELALAATAVSLASTAHLRLGQFESAVEAYKEALVTFRELAKARPDVYRPYLAGTLNNLAYVLDDLSKFEEAVDAYKEALVIHRELAKARPDVYRPDVATTLNNIAVAYRSLSKYEEAVDACQEALVIRRELAKARPDVYRPKVATTLNNIAVAYSSLSKYEEAVDACQEALVIRRELAKARPDVYRPDVAATLNNIANAYSNLSKYEEAVDAYKEALETYRQLADARPDVFRPDVAMTLNNIANVYRNLNEHEEAVDAYQEAREIYVQLNDQLGSASLRERIYLYGNYARLVLSENADLNWPDYGLARELLREGTRLGEVYRGMFGDPSERIRVQEDQRSLYRLRIDVCYQCGEIFNDPTAFEEALEAAEASRSRSLLDALAQQILPQNAPWQLRENFKTLQRDLRRAQRRLHQEFEVQLKLAKLKDTDLPRMSEDQNDDDPSRKMAIQQPRHCRNTALLTSQVAAIQQQHQRINRVLQYIELRKPEFLQLVANMRQFDSEFNPDQTVDSFRLDQRQMLFESNTTTLYVHLQQGKDHAHALVLSRQGLTPVPFPELENEFVTELASQLLTPQLQTGLKNREMQGLLMHTLPKTIQQLTTVVRETLLPALTNAGLKQGDRLVLVPDDVLGFLPWHAVPVDQTETLGDRFEVCYTRSLSILQQCMQRTSHSPKKVFGAIDPTRTLPGVELEADLASQFFQKTTILNEVDHQSLMNGARDADVFYWMGHSQFSLNVPYWSGLLIGRTGMHQQETEKGEPKSIRYSRLPVDLATFIDIDCGLTLEKCRLAIISGCQSGLALSGKGNEPVSLVSALLNAGAKAVLASLWPVDDGACVLTMHRFMLAWRKEGMSISMALTKAQHWLRDLTCEELKEWIKKCNSLELPQFAEHKMALEQIAFDHKPEHKPYHSPYYWAPFVAVGHAWAKS